MTLRPVVRKYILSIDFLLAAACTLLLWTAMPAELPILFAKDLYGIGISVLSIIFSIFFAALAIIMSSSQDDFIIFLERKQRFSELISTFRYCLGLCFVGLIQGIAFYGWASYQISSREEFQHSWFLLGFAFVFLYSLIAVLQSALDTIHFSTYRVRYLAAKGMPGAE